MSRQETYQAAVRHFQAGRGADAESLWREILAQNPDHPPSIHMLGVLALQAGRHQEALDLITRAMALKPDAAEFQGNLGSVLLAMDRVDEAISAYRQSLTLDPTSAEVHCNLGHALRRKGLTDEAILAYRQALTLRANYPKACSNLGSALREAGRLDDAIAAWRKTLTLKPDHVEARHNIAQALHDKGRLDEAIVEYQQALQLAPQAVVILNNLARALQDRGRMADAIAIYRRIVKIRPNIPEPWFNLGIAFHGAYRMDEAIDAYEKAIVLRPDYTEALTNLGVVLKEVGRFDDADACYRSAMEADPHNVIAASNIVYMHQFHADYTPRMIFDALRDWNAQHAAPLAHLICPHDNDPNPDRKLRIGYVGPDFREHVVGANLLPLLRDHDHEKFEIFCYPCVPRPDGMTRRLRQAADVWRDISSLNDDQAADLIRHDRIDILVELTLHMASHRLLLFARKPAPIQVTYLGYCGSTGLDAIDYRFSDPWLDPPEQDLSVYSETTVRLPVSYWCYQPPPLAPDPVPPPVASCGRVTFICLNNFSKVTSAAIDLWSRVLLAVTHSCMIIHAPPGRHTSTTLDRFAASGIHADRIEFVGKKPFAQYLQSYNRADICLDPIPYCGGITSCDALWMGLPVVTLAGATPVSRAGWTVLSNVGLPELVAHTPERYIEIARDLSADLPRLTELRASLRDRIKRSPLLDSRRFARDVEAAYRSMWLAWTQSR